MIEHVTQGSEVLDRAMADHARLGEHLWTVMVVYGLTAEEAATAGEGVTANLDADHRLSVSTIGCVLCEQVYEQVVGKPCKGNPVGYDTKGVPIYRDGSKA